MSKAISIFVALCIAAFLVNTYIENREAQELARQEAEEHSEQIGASIDEFASRSNAVADWGARLNDGSSYRVGPILTVELEKVWLGDRPILFIGSIKDIKTKDADNYVLVIERNTFLERSILSNSYRSFSTDLRLALVARKSDVDSFQSMYPELFKEFGFNNRVAVVANLDSIETLELADADGGFKEVKIGHGELVDIKFIERFRM